MSLHYAYTPFGISYWLYYEWSCIDSGIVETYEELESYLHKNKIEFFREVKW